MATFFADGSERLDEYATGTRGFRGAECTWRDAVSSSRAVRPIRGPVRLRRTARTIA